MKITVKHIYIILLVVSTNSLQAQDTLLLGKWQLVEMQKDSVIIFNRDDIEVTLEEARNRNKPLDSAKIQKFTEITHPLMKKMFYEFIENGDLNAGVLDLENGEYIFVEKQGAFRIDENKLGLNISGSIDSYIHTIDGDTLILTPIIGEEIYTRGYAKYERIK